MGIGFKITTSLFIALIIFTNGAGQIKLYDQGKNQYFNAKKPNQLLFNFENRNFFKNNEYFGVTAQGYTLLGYSLAPSIIYYGGSVVKFQAGVKAMKFHGEDGFSRVEPVISAHLKLAPNLDLIMGSIKSHESHGIIEQVYDTEIQFSRPVENGFQIIKEGDRFWADLWLDWEQFIRVGDAFPEVFTAGVSTSTQLLKTGSGWKINIPLQMLAWHSGGQINTDDSKMQTVVNLVLGLDITKNAGGFFNTLGCFGNLISYSDVTESNLYGINSGRAVYFGLKSEGEKGFAMLGLWNSDNFIAPKGSPLFSSLSAYDEKVIPHRRLLTGKIGYKRSLLNQINLAFLMEGYYDLPNNKFDYSYGIHMVFTPEFKIAEIPFLGM